MYIKVNTRSSQMTLLKYKNCIFWYLWSSAKMFWADNGSQIWQICEWHQPLETPSFGLCNWLRQEILWSFRQRNNIWEKLRWTPLKLHLQYCNCAQEHPETYPVGCSDVYSDVQCFMGMIHFFWLIILSLVCSNMTI